MGADHGPRRTLEVLGSHIRGTGFLEHGTELLICGTSDSASGRELETSARLAASRSRIPCVVIEDFPGNYVHVAGTRPRLLVADGERGAQLALAKDPFVVAHIASNMRYDDLRSRLHSLRSPSAEFANAVLWIGQPETEDSLTTLRRLLAALSGRGVRVWLRAHPRDPGYGHGAYSQIDMDDVTSLPLEECFARRPRLVLTQFSSVAVEAGFWGIPSVNVLFPDAGGKTLAAKKGYSVPPWCEEGAAFLIVDEEGSASVLDRALRSFDARKETIQAFDRYFKVHEEGAPILIKLLYNQGLL